MPMNKPHLEFTRIDMTTGWATPAGYPAGIKQKILASDIDETGKMGSRSRLLRFDPGVYTTAPFVHDHWEEVYLMSGDLIVGNDPQGRGGESFNAPTYACRPPGVHHGPFKSETGCMLFEIITTRANRPRHRVTSIGTMSADICTNVIPAKAGIHTPYRFESLRSMGPRFREDDPIMCGRP
jgi:hypothetical protein